MGKYGTFVSKLAIGTMMLFYCVYRPSPYTPDLGNAISLFS